MVLIKNMKYILISRLRRMLFEWQGILQFKTKQFFIRQCFSFLLHSSKNSSKTVILKASANTNAGQNRSLTDCMIKNVHFYNLKSLIFKHSLLFTHTFKNTTQLLKTFSCKLINHKCYISSFNLFHRVQTRVYSC